MRNITVLLGLIFLTTHIFGQSNFDPRIIILLPKSVEIEKGLGKQIRFYEKYGILYNKNYIIEKKDSLLNEIINSDSIPISHKEHLKNQIEFAEYLNFENSFAWKYSESFQRFLGYELENVLVTIDTSISLGKHETMMEFSQKKNADYLINIDSLIISKYNKDILVKPIFTIYYQKENRIIEIDPFEYEQYNKSSIKVDNKTLKIYSDDIDAFTKILRIIEKNGDSANREKLYKQKTLESKRIHVLDSLFIVGKTCDPFVNFDKDTILSTPLSNIYTTVCSKNNERCLVFFVVKYHLKIGDIEGVHDKIDIIYCKSEGVNWEAEYQVEGTIKISSLTQEELMRRTFRSLIDMGFFIENSIETNDEFWIKELFKNSNKKFK